ncbi:MULTISPECIES: methylglyoxal synthase [Dyella]|uniref:Methylglyoxal synthase n=2 Tax=Dyella TaxID=231454 RepID=A0A4R0YGY7_9GAMM|nr:MULTISPECIES: methylglyoxal synthase [Dyella]TBR36366.1 methylglyoxal synthase [Dyella terrae]TCI06262.1 methylglyoxal synthase [Dyella soli]
MRFGLIANPIHWRTPDAALFRWLRASAPGLRQLGVHFHIGERTYDAIQDSGLLTGYEADLRRYPRSSHGGLMKIVAEIVGIPGEDRQLDGAIHLLDPTDIASLFPESAALKRQCVIHQKPFVSTVAAARDWVEMERIHAGFAPDPGADDLHDFGRQTVALIAHDAMKGDMAEFVADHFDLLSSFGSRIGTGTTGLRLNELAWSRGWPRDTPWIERFASGPLGGDAQIADRVLERRCQRAIFFEDPHVARQHEADIQLLERAVCTVTDHAACMTALKVARRWAVAAEQRKAVVQA